MLATLLWGLLLLAPAAGEVTQLSAGASSDSTDAEGDETLPTPLIEGEAEDAAGGVEDSVDAAPPHVDAQKPAAPGANAAFDASGLRPWLDAGMQIAAGCLVASCANCVTAPCCSSLCPSGPACTLGNLLLTPLVVGVTEGVVGDLFGSRRAGLVWPVLGAYAGMGVAVVSQAVAIMSAVVLVNALNGHFDVLSSRVDFTNPNDLWWKLGGPSSPMAATGVVSAGMFFLIFSGSSALAYALFAEDKPDHAKGMRPPALLWPNNPPLEKTPSPTASNEAEAIEQRY